MAKATLTNLEAGRGNPTIDTLYALADSLSAPLGELLAPEPSETVTVVRADEGVQLPGFAVAARLLDRLSGRSQWRISRSPAAASAAKPIRIHRIAGGAVVTAGRLLVGPADSPEELAPATSATSAATAPTCTPASRRGARDRDHELPVT